MNDGLAKYQKAMTDVMTAMVRAGSMIGPDKAYVNGTDPTGGLTMEGEAAYIAALRTVNPAAAAQTMETLSTKPVGFDHPKHAFWARKDTGK